MDKTDNAKHIYLHAFSHCSPPSVIHWRPSRPEHNAILCYNPPQIATILPAKVIMDKAPRVRVGQWPNFNARLKRKSEMGRERDVQIPRAPFFPGYGDARPPRPCRNAGEFHP